VADNLILEPDVVKVDYILNRPFLGDGYSDIYIHDMRYGQNSIWYITYVRRVLGCQELAQNTM